MFSLRPTSHLCRLRRRLLRSPQCRARYTGASWCLWQQIPAIDTRNNTDRHIWPVPIKCAQRPEQHIRRRYKVTSCGPHEIKDLKEGTYRDYSLLPSHLIPKEDLHLPLGMLNRARSIAEEHTQLKFKLEAYYSSATAIQIGKLDRVATALRNYDDGFYNLQQAKDMLEWSDPSFSREELLEEVSNAKAAIKTLAEALAASLIPPHPFAHLPAIIEIRPGTGGDEAAIFAWNLYEMYTKFFQEKGWPISMISLDTDAAISGGCAIHEAIFSIDKAGAYDLVRSESGVHRVQRIPVTETKGRVHTSTATVMVLPSFPEGEADPENLVDPKDVRVDVMRASGAGGQHVNKTESAVRLTHIPTGIVVAIQDARSQHKNREKAWGILRSRIAERKRAEKEAEELAMRRKTMGGGSGVEVVGSGGGRSDKIRTYNFKEGRITDHRCGVTVYDLERILGGDVQGVEKLMEEVGKWMVGVEMERVAAEEEATTGA
ncbi:release factor [Terfezia boudieri ATCC MYA-4762]|uniref:Release factor n=1 Tax=Terfezia boudieri ATCC MYA-4762 TaxID=1051890 RepID=A0A3N4LSJ4_9PEZI|nr:release factor [Terfezia boudieri ATCC MYA-4762]